MSEDGTNTPKFKVTDRRAFASDGTPRADVDAESEQAREDESGDSQDRREPDAGARAGVVDEHPPAPQPPGPRDDGESGTEEGAGAASPRFMDLVSMLATQALVHLGEMDHPGTGTTREELTSAQLMIDFLEVLAQKTAGNLDPTEDRALRDVLYDLRMRFLAKAKVINF